MQKRTRGGRLPPLPGVDNLIDALNGKVEKNCVNPQVK
jgi:hypothetical protein